MKFQIKSWVDDSVLFKCEAETRKQAVEQAVEGGADLRGADLRGTNLRGANLGGTNLRDANLRDANLGGTNLRGTNLRGANLGGTNLRDANLRDANLRDANLRGADLRDADLGRANLSDADLGRANLGGADLGRAELRGADLGGANLRNVNLGDADLGGVNLGDADLGKTSPATPEEAIANLDRVREIILDDPDRLDMNLWHDGYEWRQRTCAEEATCGTTHCLAGWLQVCSEDEKVRKLEPQIAGIICAPIAARMFFRGDLEVRIWLQERKYVEESK